MALELFHPGLEGVIAGETNLSCVEGEFLYRGYPICELAEEARFLEVAHLLLTEELPTQEQLADFRSLLWEDACLPDVAVSFLHDLPLHVGPLEMLRSGVSLLGNCDPQLGDPILEAGLSQATRLLAQVPLLLGEWRRLRDGLPSIEPNPAWTYAGHLLAQITGREPTPLAERVFEASLILMADNAFTPSTFAARLAVSAGADAISAVTAAVAALAGPELADRFSSVLDVLSAVRNSEDAPRWVKYRVGESLPLPGFGHEGEKDADPRAALLERYCDDLAEETEGHQTEQIADAIERAVWEAAGRSPTLEWPAARLYAGLGIDRDLHAPTFVCSRLVGWCAHVIEQAESEEKIRPRSRYRGAEQQVFEPLAVRG